MLVVHGGALATILDMASGLAVLSLFGLPLSDRGYHLFTTKLDVSYLSFSPLGNFFIVEAKMRNQVSRKGKVYHTIESRISRVSDERAFLSSLTTDDDLLASDEFLSSSELTVCVSSVAEFVSRGEGIPLEEIRQAIEHASSSLTLQDLVNTHHQLLARRGSKKGEGGREEQREMGKKVVRGMMERVRSRL